MGNTKKQKIKKKKWAQKINIIFFIRERGGDKRGPLGVGKRCHVTRAPRQVTKTGASSEKFVCYPSNLSLNLGMGSKQTFQ